jgi:hypothetical protein
MCENLKFWRTELSYAQNKNRGKKMRLLGMDACPSLNDIMEMVFCDNFGNFFDVPNIQKP